MKDKLKVFTIVGTRPEIIRLSLILNSLDSVFDHSLVHTGQNYDYELNEIFFKDLEIKKPKYYLGCNKKNSVENTGLIIAKVYSLLTKYRPDAVVVLGDTNSCLSVYSAKRLKIPIFHLEAGNRCYDLRVPEEINRKLVDHISDINLPYSSISRQNLISEGISADKIIKIGSPMKEVISYYFKKIINSTILDKHNLLSKKFFLVSFHREENIQVENLKKLKIILEYLTKEYHLPIIFSTHPRTKNLINKYKLKFSRNINFVKPLSFTDYNNLQINSFLTLSDSGTISEESSILNFPALNLRETHERHEAMEEASVMMIGTDIKLLKNAMNIFNNKKLPYLKPNKVKEYDVEKVSYKIPRIIISYLKYIKSNNWKEY